MFPNNKDSVTYLPVALLQRYSRQAGPLRGLFQSPSQGDRPPRPAVDRATMNQLLVQILTEALEISEGMDLDDHSSSNL